MIEFESYRTADVTKYAESASEAVSRSYGSLHKGLEKKLLNIDAEMHGGSPLVFYGPMDTA